jgi:F-type H+-transporting ATPase subunit gamma
VAIGKKGRDFLRKHKWTLVAEYINIMTRVESPRAKEIAAQVIERYAAAQVDAVYAVYNEFKSVLTQRLVVQKLLPIEPASLDAPAGEPETPVDYLYEQPPEEILGRLLPRHVETQVLGAMLESSAAEHAARMTAMDSATNNAAELIDQLTLYMNKVRQAAITKEIIEVVSGAGWTA